MKRLRPLLALFIALTLAFSPVAGFAMTMTKSCQGMQQTMADDGTGAGDIAANGIMADCPCHSTMPNCGTMPQCQTSAGCASQCAATCGIVSSASTPLTPDHDVLTLAVLALGQSLSIQPPAPPPRG